MKMSTKEKGVFQSSTIFSPLEKTYWSLTLLPSEKIPYVYDNFKTKKAQPLTPAWLYIAVSHIL